MFDIIVDFHLNTLAIVTAFILLLCITTYVSVKSILKILMSDKTLKLVKVIDKDSAFVDEYDSNLTHGDALDYIKQNYGINALDNVEHLIDKAKEFEKRLIESLQSMRRILHIVELDFIEPKEIKDNINAAGKLMLHVENELKIFKNIFNLLTKEDPTYSEEFAEICEISNRCKALEKRINNICLALISETCLKDQ